MCCVNSVQVVIAFPRTSFPVWFWVIQVKRGTCRRCAEWKWSSGHDLWKSLWSDVMMNRCRGAWCTPACPTFSPSPVQQFFPIWNAADQQQDQACQQVLDWGPQRRKPQGSHSFPNTSPGAPLHVVTSVAGHTWLLRLTSRWLPWSSNFLFWTFRSPAPPTVV